MHIVPSLRRGGAERFVVDICNRLADAKENEVYLVSLSDNAPEGTFMDDLSSKVKYHSLAKGKGFSLVTFLELNRMLQREKPTIVHTHTNAFEYILLFRLLSISCSFFHTIHSKAEKECPFKPIKWLRRYFYTRNTMPITISKDGRSTFRSYYNLSTDILIENGRPTVQPTERFAEVQSIYKDRNKFILVHIGRIIDVKNQRLLIEAVQLFNSQSEKKCKLLLIGGVRDEQLYSKLLTLSKEDPNIVLLGDRNNIGDFLLIADAFCLSSKYEGMPISIIEAFSAACIPVSTPVGGIPEMIVNGENGFLSSGMDSKAYYQALKSCLYSSHRETLKKNCLHTFKERYDIGICAQKYIDVYDMCNKSSINLMNNETQ